MSKYLLTRPNDWPSNTHVTGFLKIPSEYRKLYEQEQPSADLMQWMNEGDKPIYMGFGSLPIPDTEKWKQILNDFLEHTSHRILFCTGWTVIDDLPNHPNLFVIKSVDHSIILQQCKAAIIHGGAGTTAAVMEAGIPMIIISILADQPYNGRMAERKKIGRHIPFKKVTSSKIKKAIVQILSDEIIWNAEELGRLTRQEDGGKECAALIEHYFQS